MAVDEKSRSQHKRDAKALKSLGEKLLKLSGEQLEHPAVTPELRQAVLDAKRFKSREAHRRQLQFVGRLMRDVDATEIRHLIEGIEAGHRQEVGFFKRAESWRDELVLGNDEVIQNICDTYPQVDRSQMNQLIRTAQLNPEGEKGKKASRSLFRFLHDLMETDPNRSGRDL